MDELPDLSKLDPAQKGALIRELWPEVCVLAAQVTALQARVAELAGWLAKNSRN